MASKSAAVLLVAMLLMLEVSALAAQAPVPGPSNNACPTEGIIHLVSSGLNVSELISGVSSILSSVVPSGDVTDCLCSALWSAGISNETIIIQIVSGVLQVLGLTDLVGSTTCISS